MENDFELTAEVTEYVPVFEEHEDVADEFVFAEEVDPVMITVLVEFESEQLAESLAETLPEAVEPQWTEIGNGWGLYLTADTDIETATEWYYRFDAETLVPHFGYTYADLIA